MNDFALKHGKPIKGVISAVLAAIKYLVVPIAIITIVISLLSGVGGDILPIDRLEAIQFSLILFSIPVIALAFLVGFYPKGSYSRMILGVVYVALICVWIWFAFQGGKLNADIEMVGAGLDFSPLLLLIVFAASLKAIYYLAEAPSYRSEFLRNSGMVPVDEGGAPPAPVEIEEGSVEEVAIEQPIVEEPADERVTGKEEDERSN